MLNPSSVESDRAGGRTLTSPLSTLIKSRSLNDLEGGKNGRTDGGGERRWGHRKGGSKSACQTARPPSDVIRTKGMKGGKEGVVFLLLRACERETG